VTEERIIPFPAFARSQGEPEPLPRRRREVADSERPPARRTPRRRRQQTPWLQRNALSVAAVSILIAILGLGFGLLQVVTRPDPAATVATSTFAETNGPQVAGVQVVGASSGVQQAGLVGGPNVATVPTSSRREIVASAKVLEPNYTVAAGDTLGQIAARFNTTVDRIQALNNLADPRSLRIGTRLVIPQALSTQ
jgi:LysM repeat protein